MEWCSVALSFTIGIAEGSLEAVYWHSTRIWKQQGRRYLERCKFPSLCCYLKGLRTMGAQDKRVGSGIRLFGLSFAYVACWLDMGKNNFSSPQCLTC